MPAVPSVDRVIGTAATAVFGGTALAGEPKRVLAATGPEPCRLGTLRLAYGVRSYWGEDVENYLIIGAILLAGWLLISRPLSRAKAAQHQGARFRRSIISLIVAGGCAWFAWWMLATRCGGSC